MECNGPECSTVTTSTCECNSSSQDCACGGHGCPGCNPNINPLDFMTKMWQKAALTAMFEVKKDKVKEKMLKAYGDVIDKGADATVEAFGKKIMSMMESAHSEQEFKNKLAAIMNEIKRK
jgi:hypothetical protein